MLVFPNPPQFPTLNNLRRVIHQVTYTQNIHKLNLVKGCYSITDTIKVWSYFTLESVQQVEKLVCALNRE